MRCKASACDELTYVHIILFFSLFKNFDFFVVLIKRWTRDCIFCVLLKTNAVYFRKNVFIVGPHIQHIFRSKRMSVMKSEILPFNCWIHERHTEATFIHWTVYFIKILMAWSASNPIQWIYYSLMNVGTMERSWQQTRIQ